MQLGVFAEPQQGASYEQQRRVAIEAERLDFDAFFRSDHYVRIGEGDPRPGPTDSWLTLAALARDTATIRLGTLVTSATFRLPGPLAISVAQVDAMSAGRVEFGLGTGWYDDEHRAYGIPFPPLRERFERLEEQLRIVTGLWTTAPGDTFTFRGDHYELVDSPALPKPVQSPHPPIVLGGLGPERTPALAARFAAEFNVPFPPLADYERLVGAAQAACEAAGRDPDTLIPSVALVLCCGRDDAEIARRADAIGREPDELRSNGLAGTPAEVLERLRDFARAGARRVYLQTLDLDDLDHLRLVADEVLPAARDL